MKIRFLLILLLSAGLAACAAVGVQPQAQSGTQAPLSNFLSQTQTGGQTDLVGQTATPAQNGAASQPSSAPAAMSTATVQTSNAGQAVMTTPEEQGTEQPEANGTAAEAQTTEQPETNETAGEAQTTEQPESTGEAMTTEQPEGTETTGQANSAEQDEPTKTQESTGENNNNSENNTAQGAVIPATGMQVSFDQLSDYHVVDSTGVQLGDVKDAVISLNNSSAGQIPYLVVSSSAREDWYVPVPWGKVQVRPDTQTIVLPVTAAQFAAAPGFNKDAWPSSFTGQNALQSYWANPGMAGQAVTLGMTGAAADYVRAHDLTDLKVVSPQGVKLGKIQDLAINWQNSPNGAAAAQFGYVIMELDDSISQANALVPVPWRLVRVVPGQENLVLNIPANVLQTAPNFIKGALPNLYAEPVNGTLNQFWGNK